MSANSEARKRNVQRAMGIASAALASQEAHEDYFERLIEEHDAKTDKILLGHRECVKCGDEWDEEQPPNDAIRNLLNAYLAGNPVDRHVSDSDIALIREWLDYFG